jgi:putative cardiolipin synthase
LADRISKSFDRRVPDEAYGVGLSPDHRLYWLEHRGETVLRHDLEPGTNYEQRMGVRVMSMLPIEWLL